MTLAVAARFGTQRMLGLDIDEELVKAACRSAQVFASKPVKLPVSPRAKLLFTNCVALRLA